MCSSDLNTTVALRLSLAKHGKTKVIIGKPVEVADQLLKQGAVRINAVRPVKSLKRVLDRHSSLETI